MKKSLIAGLAALVAASFTLAGCGGSAATSTTDSTSPDQVTGEVKVLTNRTDLVTDGSFAEMAEEFKKTYPQVTVTFEGITDYEGQVSIRLNTKDYGDVLALPNSVKADQYSAFFEPLGAVADLSQQYRFTGEHAYDTQVYSLSTGGNANGVVYNKAVFTKAGVTALPKTPEEFLAALQKVKDNTDATPLYTNYKDGWPLSQWFGNLGGASGNADAKAVMAGTDAPWSAGNDVYAMDGLLYSVVKAGLVEADPLTTNWEKSKDLLATGKVAAMPLGSWAISQMEAAATTAGADPADIGYMAFPTTAPDGKQYATIGGDYSLAINVNSSVKPAARAWIDWFVTKSGYAEEQGMISTDLSAALPETLSDLTANNVTLLELNQLPAGQESLLNDLANESEVDIYGYKYRQKLVDIARGAATGDMESYFAELNTKWAKARSAIG